MTAIKLHTITKVRTRASVFNVDTTSLADSTGSNPGKAASPPRLIEREILLRDGIFGRGGSDSVERKILLKDGILGRGGSDICSRAFRQNDVNACRDGREGSDQYLHRRRTHEYKSAGEGSTGKGGRASHIWRSARVNLYRGGRSDMKLFVDRQKVGNPALPAGLQHAAVILLIFSPGRQDKLWAPPPGRSADRRLKRGKLTRLSTSTPVSSCLQTFAIPEADYTITMVPEPGTWAGAALTLLALISTQRRRIA
jgi:hypothetical protein